MTTTILLHIRQTDTISPTLVDPLVVASPTIKHLRDTGEVLPLSIGARPQGFAYEAGHDQIAFTMRW